jgi:hypothetical protein
LPLVGTSARCRTHTGQAAGPGRTRARPTRCALGTIATSALAVGTDPAAYGRAIDEQITFLRPGIDGLFNDNPDVGVPRVPLLAAA